MTIDEAINILKQYVDYDNPDVPDFYTMEEAIKVIIEALEQEPKTGHWIYDNTTNNWRCDKCGRTPKTMGYVGTDKFMAEHFKFCNHCGAKMAESEE